MTEHATLVNAISTIGRNRVGPEMMSRSQPRSTLPMKLFHFNISGQPFIVSSQLVQKFPGSKFCSPQQLAEHWEEDLGVFYFDRDPALFNTILNIFRYDVLNIPPGYDQDLVLEEVKYWNVPIDRINRKRNAEEARIEAEFQWLENRIPPPSEGSKNWLKTRYKMWCFIADPLGPYTPYRKLSVACCATSIVVTVFYLILVGLSSSAYFREPDYDPNARDNQTSKDMESATAAIGCTSLPRIDCYLLTYPHPWIETTQLTIACFFITETMMRLLLCPSRVYFKSFVNWMDILATIGAIVVIVLLHIDDKYGDNFDSENRRSLHYAWIMLDCSQVLRVFRIFQYANVIDGLMVMILTLKASFKELLLLVMYLLIAMFLFSTLIFFFELQVKTGTGIPDALYGYWWAIITMTTVGYGDFYPTTTAGYFIGVMCSISGIILTALPVAVIGSNFNTYWEHNRRRRSALMASFKQEGEERQQCFVDEKGSS